MGAVTGLASTVSNAVAKGNTNPTTAFNNISGPGPLGGLTGTAGGAGGTGFGAPTQANITSPVSTQQVGQANAGVGNSLQSQQQLLGLLQGQNAMTQQNNTLGSV